MGRIHRGSKDGNHDAIVGTFEAMGCSVADLHKAGLKDWPDLVVGVCGVNHLVEIKNPETAYGRSGLSVGQGAFARDWRGGRVWVVSSEDEVIAVVTNWRRACK